MRTYAIFAGVVTILFASGLASAQDFNPYSFDYYDSYRAIQYWAVRSLSIGDYNYGSGDAKAMHLTQTPTSGGLLPEPSADLVRFFDSEFSRILKGNLPFYDANKGRNERFKALYQKYGKQDDFLDIVDAQELARRNAMYGPNPAAVYCNIKIARSEFPVLFQIRTSVIAREDLRNSSGAGLQEDELGFSSPEYISQALKRAITAQITAIAEELSKVRSAKGQ